MTELATDVLRPRACTTLVPSLRGADIGLYAVTVGAWSTSWIAMHLQVGVIAPEVSLVWRFILATGLMFGWAAAAGAGLRHSWRMHLRFALLGASLFSLNFLCFYHAAQSVPSGLLSVVFSGAALFNLGLGALLFRERIEMRSLAGAAAGLAGIALMFMPQLRATNVDGAALSGLLLGVLGTVLFCGGNMVSLTIGRAGVGTLAANAWGMFYGALLMSGVALARGETFTIAWNVGYIGSLLWLSVVSSVIAYVCYLTLLRRIGAGRAGYATVIFPIFALMISTLFEGYVWSLAAVCGLVLAAIGNVTVMRKR